MSQFFYDQTIDIYHQVDGSMFHGVWRPGAETLMASIIADVQPTNREQIYREYGYYVEAEKRIFTDLCPYITEGAIIGLDGKRYKVAKVIEWDDYLDVMAQAYTQTGEPDAG